MRYSSPVKLERMIIAAAVLLVIGLAVFCTSWHGSAGFSTGLPLTQSILQLSGSTNGMAAVIGPLSAVLGLLILIISAVVAFFNLLDARRVKDTKK